MLVRCTLHLNDRWLMQQCVRFVSEIWYRSHRETLGSISLQRCHPISAETVRTSLRKQSETALRREQLNIHVLESAPLIMQSVKEHCVSHVQ